MATTQTMASDAVRTDFLGGLRNAHAIEAQASQILQRQIDRSSDYPDVVSRLKKHLDETHMQQERLEHILSGMGETPSATKDIVLGAVGNIMALGHAVASDEIIKNTLQNAAFEHYEAAMYRSLLAMADACGATEAAQKLQESLHEEELMAAWVDEHTAEVTRTYLARHQRGEA